MSPRKTAERLANEAHNAAENARDHARDEYERWIAQALMTLSTAVAELARDVDAIR